MHGMKGMKELYRITIRPTTFRIEPFQSHQNPYITPTSKFSKTELLKNHRLLENALTDVHSYTLHTKEDLPDIVFIANGGLSLMNLPERVIILPSMKYDQRRHELKYLKEIYEKEGIRTIQFPLSEVFEGQAEAKWFHHGKLLVCTYGYRSSRHSFTILNQMLKKIYTSYGRTPPTLLVLPVESPYYYHTDIAMLEYAQTSCIVQKGAFSAKSIARLREALGTEHVHILEDECKEDKFCLNTILDGDKLITHKISDHVKHHLEIITKKKVHMIDTSIVQMSGGSVRCMVLDVHPPIV
jgi:N-dimethylarginine dimethylaminohydrolase